MAGVWYEGEVMHRTRRAFLCIWGNFGPRVRTGQWSCLIIHSSTVFTSIKLCKAAVQKVMNIRKLRPLLESSRDRLLTASPEVTTGRANIQHLLNEVVETLETACDFAVGKAEAVASATFDKDSEPLLKALTDLEKLRTVCNKAPVEVVLMEDEPVSVQCFIWVSLHW